jgi:uncharacterized protein YnzC (UPF0291/DUF896 family)
MGLFSGISDAISSVTPDLGFGGSTGSSILGMMGVNPLGQLGILEGDSFLGEFGQFLADPMDLFGVRAGQTQEEISGILEESTRAGIEAQEEQRERIRQMYEPWYQSAISSALPQLQAMSEGGEIDYTPSKLYEYQKKTGERNIKRSMAGRGLSESSAAEEKMSDFRLGLAEEEMDRLYAGELSRVQLGSGAADAVGAASRSLGGNVAGLYSNLGGGLNIAQQQYGQARQSAYEGLASSLSGMAQYMEQGA